jgi:hypothetical protein
MARKVASERELIAKHVQFLNVAIKDQADIGCALIFTSYIENGLMTLLSEFFIKGEPSVKKGIFNVRGPLGTYSACRDIAYLLGLISGPIFKNLETLGEIRNRFAHSVDTVDFNEPSVEPPKDRKNVERHQGIKELCHKLTFPKTRAFHFRGKAQLGEPDVELSARERFVEISTIIFHRIWMKIKELEPADPALAKRGKTRRCPQCTEW